MESVSIKDDDLFHSVVMAEESTWQKGYTQGIEVGRQKGYSDGFKLGAKKGTELGKEVGFYAGYAVYILKASPENALNPRISRLCDSILKMANAFPSLNPRDEALTENVMKLQSKFKQLTSLLGVRLQYEPVVGTSKPISF